MRKERSRLTSSSAARSSTIRVPWPRLPGRPGDPEFVAAYNAAIAEKAKQPSGTLQGVLNAYQNAPKFTDLAERTRRDYVKHIRKIEAEYAVSATAGIRG